MLVHIIIITIIIINIIIIIICPLSCWRVSKTQIPYYSPH